MNLRRMRLSVVSGRGYILSNQVIRNLPAAKN